MPRQSAFRLPYLQFRKESGKFAYWRRIPADVAKRLSGSVKLSWALRDHELSGTSQLRLSLKTGDEATARARWGQVHAQVEAHVEAAIRRMKDAKAGPSLERRSQLGANEVATIAAQVRHDVLAEHDEAWVDPAHMPSELARGLQAAMAQISDGTLTKPLMVSGLDAASLPLAGDVAPIFLTARDMETILKARFPQGLDDNGVRAAARVAELDALRESLGDKDTGRIDSPPVLEEAWDPFPGGGYKLTETSQIPGELSARLAENGIDLADERERRKAALGILRAKIAALEDTVLRDEGRAIETPARPEPIVPPAKRAPGLRELHKTWIGKMRPSRKAVDDNALYVERFIAVNGDMPITQIRREHIVRYRNMLEVFPPSAPATVMALPLEEIVDWAKANQKPTLARTTINAKGIGSISALFDTAIRDAVVDVNLCAGMHLPKATAKKRLSFDQADLKRLLASPLYADPGWLPDAGGGEAAFWMPLIGLFAGARMEEIGQLLASDIKSDRGVPYFHITTLGDDEDETAGSKHKTGDAAEKSLKTEAAHRCVPVHPTLIAIGFLHFVARCRKEKRVRLFGKLVDYRGRCTKNWSRWWNRYQDKYVTKMLGKVFHSFRHGFTDAMRDVRIEEIIQKALLGHAGGDVTSKYGRGYIADALAPEIAKISYSAIDAEAVATLAAVARGKAI
jgi:integrase